MLVLRDVSKFGIVVTYLVEERPLELGMLLLEVGLGTRLLGRVGEGFVVEVGRQVDSLARGWPQLLKKR